MCGDKLEKGGSLQIYNYREAMPCGHPNGHLNCGSPDGLNLFCTSFSTFSLLTFPFLSISVSSFAILTDPLPLSSLISPISLLDNKHVVRKDKDNFYPYEDPKKHNSSFPRFPLFFRCFRRLLPFFPPHSLLILHFPSCLAFFQTASNTPASASRRRAMATSDSSRERLSSPTT
jgi:hypothetical protein